MGSAVGQSSRELSRCLPRLEDQEHGEYDYLRTLRHAKPILSLNVMRLHDWLVTLLTKAMTHGEVTQSSLDLSNILILKQKNGCKDHERDEKEVYNSVKQCSSLTFSSVNQDNPKEPATELGGSMLLLADLATGFLCELQPKKAEGKKCWISSLVCHIQLCFFF